MYFQIRFKKNGKPYKYLVQCVYNKRRKTPVPKVVKYIGKATAHDISKYYKGKKYAHLVKKVKNDKQ